MSIESATTYTKISSPGGPIIIASLKKRMPYYAFTDLDLRTYTLSDFDIRVPIVELSVIIKFPLMSISSNVTLSAITFPLTKSVVSLYTIELFNPRLETYSSESYYKLRRLY